MIARRVAFGAADVALALGLLPAMELLGRALGPAPLVAALRRIGRHAPQRDPVERAWLRRAIAAVDARLPGGARCYRVVLVELTVDRAAAGEPMVMGLDKGMTRRSGHAWLGDRRGRERPYDVEISL